MPVLSNPKHERFAQEIAKGISGAEAYRVAGYAATGNSSAVNANRLLKDAKVAERVNELLDQRNEMALQATEKAADALSIDRQWIIGRLKENVERAMQASAVKDDEGNPIGEYRYDGGVANRALELLGKELGMFIDRKEIRTGALDGLPPDTLAAAREQLIAARDRRADRSLHEGHSGKPH